ncbi:MAG: TetR family transcriptional regulator, partial [Actinomycetota bacterium]|nr:TetR family transcriptional regulator [Actinomycetota bacterium]
MARSRDPVATREAILRAAEVLFAERGYDGASMQDIASAAGVSRGMPGYAFGPKRELYEAVLTRAFAEPRALASQLMASLGADDPEAALRAAIEGYIDFLAQHPTYLRLLQRAALDGGGELGEAAASAEGLTDALPAADALLKAAGFRAVDARQLLVSAIALCFFPFAHNDTLLRPLGLDAEDPRFLAERKSHVVDLLLTGLGERAQGSASPVRGAHRPRG